MASELAQIHLAGQARGWLDQVWVLTRRELRDIMRDWRITIPIVTLTLIFPALMQITAALSVDWVRRYGGSELISERTYPFLLMVVGFFPLSFSLVIALEAFVGEKERKSLETLLVTPLSDGQLYFAKMLASLIPVVMGSYLGISVYLTGLMIFRGWRPSFDFVALIMALTTAKAVVMVSGAVVVSSQTTSVRAANLLASFIIIPMTLLVQAESIVMFWGKERMLWWVVVMLIVVDLLLTRMAVQLFDREELMGREIDEMSPGTIWRTLRRFWARVELDGREEPVTLGRIYRRDVPAIWRRVRLPTALIALAALAAGIGGALAAPLFPLPATTFDASRLSPELFQDLPVGMLPVFSGMILFQNVRALLVAALLAVFSFGVVAVLVMMFPVSVIGYTAAQFASWGYNPLVFLAAFILPHGVLELPAAALAAAAALRLGAAFIARQPGLTVGESWLAALADFVKLFVFVVLPLLILAALVEANVTPHIVVMVYGAK